MSIYQASKDDLAALLTTASGVPITSSQFDIILMRPTVAADNSVFNTRIRVNFNSTATLAGAKDFFFDRLNLADLPKLNYFTSATRYRAVVGVGLALTSILTIIRDNTGAVFTSADLEDQTTTGDSSGVSVILRAKSTSVGWYGECVANFSLPPSISTVFTTDVLGTF